MYTLFAEPAHRNTIRPKWGENRARVALVPDRELPPVPS
jgi:hypothetical protein